MPTLQFLMGSEDMTEQAQDYNLEELMAIVISRLVMDFETIGVGAASPVPAAGSILAKQLHAPHAQIIMPGSKEREYYPFPAGSSELHFLAQRGDLDLFFLSGIQIDRKGNINLHVIGDYENPRMRLPGAYGSAMLYYMARRVILFRTEHTTRSLVERVDFITAPGVTSASVHRKGGPSLVVTPKASLAWDQQAAEWALDAIHPGASEEEIKENTGFPLKVSPSVKATPPPTDRELLTLRTIVREKLKPTYPDFAQKKIRAA
jgi:glutaconate CoA-transferase subunit B